MSALSATILIATYNRAELLPQTLDCALAQDHERVEVLVLDDGSTDDTTAVLSDYAGRNPGRLRWSRHENIGQPATLNRGFELISSDLICLISSDDLMAPSTVRLMAEALDGEPEAVVAYPDFDLINEDGATVDSVRSLDFEVAEAIRLHDCCIGPGAVFRRSLPATIGGWDPRFRYCPDFDFWIRAGLVGRFVHVHEYLAGLRQHGGSLSGHRNLRMAAERIRLMDKVYARTDLPEAVTAVRDEAYRAAYVQAALVCGGTPNDLHERFIIADRLAPRLLPSNDVDFQAELLRKEVDARVAQEALHELHDQLRWLHGEIAKRDALIAERQRA